MPVRLNSSGGGSVTLDVPSTAGTFTATIPANSGTVVTTGSTAAVTPAMLSTGAPNWDSSGNLSFNSGYGSVATAFGCRAWVNFNGTGTVAIRGSGNVSSISDNGTGDYTINFTTAMPDANYGVSFAWDPNLSVTANESRAYNFATPAAGSLRVYTYSSTTAVAAEDWQFISVSIFR